MDWVRAGRGPGTGPGLSIVRQFGSCWQAADRLLSPVLHVRSHTAVLHTLRGARTLQSSPADQESKVGTSSSLSLVPVMLVIESFLGNQLRLNRTDEVISLI